MAVTIKDIAKKTGLGGSTISAYLNGVTVRPYNKEKIERAIKELGYIRNDYARGLKTHKSKTIGVLIPELSNIFATTIISETEEVLRGMGYGIIVCDCRSNKKLEQTALRFLLSKMVDGLIVMPISTEGKALKAATENGIPTVVIDRLTDSGEISHITINNREISRKAVEELLKKGCKHIAMIGGCADIYTARERGLGFRDAMKSAGVYDASYEFDGGYNLEGGYQAVKELLKLHPETDGVFVGNYEMTVGSIIALNESEKKPGEEIQFIGFDNVEMSKIFTPKLRTVNQPLKEIGQVAADTILAMLSGKPVRNIVLEANIE